MGEKKRFIINKIIMNKEGAHNAHPQTVDKVLGFLPGIFCIKEAKKSYFQDFSVSFGIIKVSKRRYCSMMTQETEKVRKQNADGMY